MLDIYLCYRDITKPVVHRMSQRKTFNTQYPISTPKFQLAVTSLLDIGYWKLDVGYLFVLPRHHDACRAHDPILQNIQQSISKY
jgi:hypothetical protein